MQTIIEAKFFKERKDLENHVRNKHGLTPEPKPLILIQGTRQEMARLQLSDRTIFWGINCVITDSPTENKKESKPDRGELKEFGINIKNK